MMPRPEVVVGDCAEAKQTYTGTPARVLRSFRPSNPVGSLRSALAANPETRLTNVLKGGWSRQTRFCACGHDRQAHRHYRRGTDCALCDCQRWRSWRGLRQLLGRSSSDSPRELDDGRPRGPRPEVCDLASHLRPKE
jgi:hypothetical protein